MSASSDLMTARADEPILRVEDIHKQYGGTRAVDGVSFDIAPGEIAAILGPSGCGKSTVLHLIAGLEAPDHGEIFWNGEPLAGVPPHRRGFGLMFQEYALFPHMDIGRNIGFGLRMQDMRPKETAERVAEVLDLVGLPGFEDREVDQLSGGERQRVALARAMAPKPSLLMLDEPLGALDRTLKERLMLELPRILRATEQTALYVTHDQEEAFAVADRMIVMRQGSVVRSGTPKEIYQQPRTTFVARFLGLDNILNGAAKRSDHGSRVRTAIGEWPVDGTVAGEVTVLIRPEQVELGAGDGVQITGQVIELSFRGANQRVVMRSDDLEFSFDFPSEIDVPAVGQPIRVHFDPADAVQLLS
ncbi:MAG: ABC transporter ATP-binding protein [Anaerolineales bacterium]